MSLKSGLSEIFNIATVGVGGGLVSGGAYLAVVAAAAPLALPLMIGVSGFAAGACIVGAIVGVVHRGGL